MKRYASMCGCWAAVHSLFLSLFATTSPVTAKAEILGGSHSSMLLCLHDIQSWVDSWGSFPFGNTPIFRPCSVSTGWQLVSVASAPAGNITKEKKKVRRKYFKFRTQQLSDSLLQQSILHIQTVLSLKDFFHNVIQWRTKVLISA